MRARARARGGGGHDAARWNGRRSSRESREAAACAARGDDASQARTVTRSQVMRARSRLGRATSGVSRVHRTFSVHGEARGVRGERRRRRRRPSRAADENRRETQKTTAMRLETFSFSSNPWISTTFFGFRRTASRVRSIARSRRAHGRHRTVEAPSLARRHRIPARRSAHLRTFPRASPIHSDNFVQIVSCGRHGTNRCDASSAKKSSLHASRERVAPACTRERPPPSPPSRRTPCTPPPPTRLYTSRNPFNCMCTTRVRTASVCSFPQHVDRCARRETSSLSLCSGFAPRSRERGVVFLIHARPDVFARASADDDARGDDDRRFFFPFSSFHFHLLHFLQRAPDRSRAGPRARPPPSSPPPPPANARRRRKTSRPSSPSGRARVLRTTDGRDVRAPDNAHRVRRSRALRARVDDEPPRPRASTTTENARASTARACGSRGRVTRRGERDDRNAPRAKDMLATTTMATVATTTRARIVSRSGDAGDASRSSRARAGGRRRGADEEDEARRRRARGGDGR